MLQQLCLGNDEVMQLILAFLPKAFAVKQLRLVCNATNHFVLAQAQLFAKHTLESSSNNLYLHAQPIFTKYLKHVHFGRHCKWQHVVAVVKKFAKNLQTIEVRIEQADDTPLVKKLPQVKILHLQASVAHKFAAIAMPQLQQVTLRELNDLQQTTTFSKLITSTKEMYLEHCELGVIDMEVWLLREPQLARKLRSVAHLQESQYSLNIVGTCRNITTLRMQLKKQSGHQDVAFLAKAICELKYLQSLYFDYDGGDKHKKYQPVYDMLSLNLLKIKLTGDKIEMPDVSHLNCLQSFKVENYIRSVPQWISSLKAVQKLSLRLKNTSGISNASLPPSVESASLSEFDAIPATFFEHAKKLKKLCLSESHIVEWNDKVKQNLVQLQHLELVNSSSSDWPFESCPNLRLIAIEQQMNALPKAIVLLPHLQTLFLQNVNLVAFPVQVLQIASLTELNLENNAITTIPVELETDLCLTKLQSLSMHGNPLTSVPDFSQNPHLQAFEYMVRLDDEKSCSPFQFVSEYQGYATYSIAAHCFNYCAANRSVISADDALCIQYMTMMHSRLLVQHCIVCQNNGQVITFLCYLDKETLQVCKMTVAHYSYDAIPSFYEIHKNF